MFPVTTLAWLLPRAVAISNSAPAPCCPAQSSFQTVARFARTAPPAQKKSGGFSRSRQIHPCTAFLRLEESHSVTGVYFPFLARSRYTTPAITTTTPTPTTTIHSPNWNPPPVTLIFLL